MDSPLPLHPLEELSEARPVRRRASRELKEEGLSPDRIAPVATAIGALVATALVMLLLY